MELQDGATKMPTNLTTHMAIHMVTHLILPNMALT